MTMPIFPHAAGFSGAFPETPNRRPRFPNEAFDLFPDQEANADVMPEDAEPEDAEGFPELGFDILKTSLGVWWTDDIKVRGPSSQIGVRMPGKRNLAWNWTPASRLVINHRSKTNIGIESVNVKMRCRIRYNGPEVLASFGFDAGGKRSRLARDTEIVINNPLPRKTVAASAAWRKIGVERFPVIEIPIEFRIDHPWPTSNREETFSLILSGYWGFGAPGLKAIINRRVVRT